MRQIARATIHFDSNNVPYLVSIMYIDNEGNYAGSRTVRQAAAAFEDTLNEIRATRGLTYWINRIHSRDGTSTVDMTSMRYTLEPDELMKLLSSP